MSIITHLVLLQKKLLKRIASNSNFKKNYSLDFDDNEFKLKAISLMNFKINEILFVLTNFSTR